MSTPSSFAARVLVFSFTHPSSSHAHSVAQVIKDVSFQWFLTHLSSPQSCQNIAHRLGHWHFWHPHLPWVRCVTWQGCAREVALYPSETSICTNFQTSTCDRGQQLRHGFFCSPVVSHSRTHRPKGLEEKLFEHVVPLTRSLSGSAVSIERTVYGHPSASLVCDKAVEDILCSFVGENGTPATSVHTEKNDKYPRHLCVDEKTMVCRKERLALMWTAQRNTYDLEFSQSWFAAMFSESNRSHHGRNQHNQRGCFVRNSTLYPQEKTLQHADMR